jgi:phage recombination protein Bet
MNTTAITKPTAQAKASALNVMATRYSVEPTKLLETLKATVFKAATNEELLALVVVANEYKLNPFTKQIYGFPAKGGGIVPVVSIDGWAAIMNANPEFDGIDFEYADTEDGKPISVTAVIHVKGRSQPTRVTEYFSECFRPTEPWKQMPRRMLRHKALAQGVRIAFGMSGIYDEEEAADIAGKSMLPPSDKPTLGRTRAAESLPETTVIDVGPVGMTDAEKQAAIEREAKEAQ